MLILDIIIHLEIFVLFFYFFPLQVEYVILKVDHKNKIARLSLRGGEILKKLNAKEQENPE